MQKTLPALCAFTLLSFPLPLPAETFTLQIPPSPPSGPARHMGASRSPNPRGGDIAWDNFSLLKNNQPWIPVMGEFHFSRYPRDEWRTELLKMKAGGINIVSTYVFWIFHEEDQGTFDWSGNKDLREFVRLCGEVGLNVIVRIGPWCHGEVRNGGFPDWVQKMPRTRTNDPAYLAAVKTLYDQIGRQLQGQLWKDGGPVIGVQLENEYHGAAEHLMTLKRMAIDAGIDVPIYTRTAWDAPLRGQVPYGEILPLFGGYAEGFWDRELTTMPRDYWTGFRFAAQRMDTMVGADATGARQAGDTADVATYPYLTCELGGGMPSSYHRRIWIDPIDVYAIPIVKIGSGGNLTGYYMYHGGTNPEGKHSTLQESQLQNMWNDMPEKTYDFQAPLGEYGQIRESYHLLRQLHLFLADWGSDLARMSPTFGPAPRGKDDTQTLRFAVRSDGTRGFLFVNNYQRAQNMPAKSDTAFDFKLVSGEQKIPDPGAGGSSTISIPPNLAFIWPIHLDLGGATLAYATAQPLCRLVDGNQTLTFFAQTPGVESEFVIDAPGKAAGRGDNSAVWLDNTIARQTIRRPGSICFRNVQSSPAYEPSIVTHTADGREQDIFLLDPQSALGIYKASIGNRPRVFISRQNLFFDNDTMTMSTLAAAGEPAGEFGVTVYPELRNALPEAGGPRNVIQSFGDYTSVYRFTLPATGGLAASAELVKPAGALRQIKLGSQHVASAPTDADFDQAAVWRITLPAGLGADRRLLLRIHYLGDVARVYVGGRRVDDDFYNGKPLDIGLWRYAPDILAKDLEIRILPLQKGAPIYLTKPPEFQGGSIARIDSVEVLEERSVRAQLR